MIIDKFLLPRFLILELVLIFHLLQMCRACSRRLESPDLDLATEDDFFRDDGSTAAGQSGGGLEGLRRNLTSSIISRCSLDLDNVGWRYSPLISSPDGADILPDVRDDDLRQISLSENTEVLLSCPGYRIKDTSLSQITITCSSSGKFTNDNEDVDLSKVGCTRSPREEELLVEGLKCGPSQQASLVKLGHRVGGRFVERVTVCHDPSAESTLYASHTLLGSRLEARNVDSGRPSFKEGKIFFDSLSANKAYQQKSQKNVLARIYGFLQAKKYFAPRQQKYLARGHLAPDADFIYGDWQQATYFYANAVPQWQSFNNGNWKQLEEAVRDFAAFQDATLKVVTGSLDVLQLEDEQRRWRPLYLGRVKGADNNTLIPVPEYVWKVIVRPDTDEGIAIVGLNNPFLPRISRSKIFCSDVCEEAGWNEPLDNREDLARGYIFCCRIDDFRRTVGWLPDDMAAGRLLVYT